MEHSTKGETENMTKFPGSSLQLTTTRGNNGQASADCWAQDRLKHINLIRFLIPYKLFIFNHLKTRKTLLQ